MGLLHRLWSQWQTQSNNDGITINDESGLNIVPHYIDGQRLLAVSADIEEIINPLTTKAERHIYAAGEEQINAAISSAKLVKDEWQQTDVLARIKMLQLLRELIHASSKDLLAILVEELSITPVAAQQELDYALSILEGTPQWQKLLDGDYSLNRNTMTETVTFPQSVGLVLGIEKSHLPLVSCIWLISSALACGNVVIFLPSSFHPSVAIFLADLLEKVQLPKGVFNVLQNNKKTLDLILKHHHIYATIFMGEYPDTLNLQLDQSDIARFAIIEERRALAVVFPDANLQETAKILVNHFISGIQNAQALSAIVIIGDVSDDFVNKLSQELSIIIEKSAAKLGILATEKDWLLSQSLLKRLSEEGSEFIIDGRNTATSGWQTGISLVDFVSPNSNLFKQNRALPILPIVRLADRIAAQDFFNQHKIFNTFGVFTEDTKTTRKSLQQINASLISINDLIMEPVATMGISALEAKNALEIFTKTKKITNKWGK